MLLKLLPLPIKKLAVAALPKLAFALVQLPVKLKLVPVAAPILGVMSVGVFASTTTSPVPVRLAKLICCPVTTTGLTPKIRNYIRKFDK
jgi:hypothetical protein